MCVDQASDNLMRDRGSRQKPDCPVMGGQPGAGSKVNHHSVCRMEKTTATCDGRGPAGDAKIRVQPTHAAWAK